MQTDGQKDGRTDRMQAVVTCSLRLVSSPPCQPDFTTLHPALVQYRIY